MSLIEKVVNTICDICESNFILDHITRLGMSDEYYVMAMALEAKKKAAAAEKAPRKWLMFGRAGAQAREGE